MQTQFNNYTSFVEEGGRRFLFNDQLFRNRVAALDSFDNAFAQVKEWLEQKTDFPGEAEFIIGAVYEGPAFLRRKLIEDTKKADARLKIPRHIAKVHLKAAETAADEIDTADLDTIRAQFRMMQEANGLTIAPENLYQTKGGVKVERKTVEAAIRRACMLPVTDEQEQFAALMKETILKLRPFMDLGFPVREVFDGNIGNYLDPDGYNTFEDDLNLVRFICTNMKPSRALVRMKNRDTFILLGGRDTAKERRARGLNEDEQ